MEDSGFDLQLGGTHFLPGELFEIENIQPEKTAKQRILDFNNASSKKDESYNSTPNPTLIIPPPPPAPISTQPSRPFIPAIPRMQSSSTQVSPFSHSPPLTPPQRSYQNTSVQTDAPTRSYQPTQSFFDHINQVYPVRHVTYVNDYSPVVYRRLYDYGLNFIPSYYSYDQRRKIEYLLEDLIKKELTSKRSEYDLEKTIKKLIDNSSYEVRKENKSKPVKPETLRKPSRKLSKKPSKKKSAKQKKKPSKKPSKKHSKKTSKKISKKIKK